MVRGFQGLGVYQTACFYLLIFFNQALGWELCLRQILMDPLRSNVFILPSRKRKAITYIRRSRVLRPRTNNQADRLIDGGDNKGGQGEFSSKIKRKT